MKDTDLIAALRRMKINTNSFACLGCKYFNNCGTKGCRLIASAADRLEKYAAAIETIKAMHTAASGVGKTLLRDVLALFDNWYGQTPEPSHMVFDFEHSHIFCTPLVVQCNVIMQKTELDDLRRDLKNQFDSGLVVVPAFCSVVSSTKLYNVGNASTIDPLSARVLSFSDGDSSDPTGRPAGE